MKHVSTALAATFAFAMAAGIVNSSALHKPGRTAPDDVAEAETGTPARPELQGKDAPGNAPAQVSASASTAPDGIDTNTTEPSKNNRLSIDPEIKNEVLVPAMTAAYGPFLPDSQAPESKAQVSTPPVLEPARAVRPPRGPLHAAPAPGLTPSGSHWKHFASRPQPVRYARPNEERRAHIASERGLGFSGSFGGCYYSGYVTAAGYQIHKSC